MTMQFAAVVVVAHLYEVGLGEGDAVGGAHGAAKQLGGGGGSRAADRGEGREQRVDDRKCRLEQRRFFYANATVLIP